MWIDKSRLEKLNASIAEKEYFDDINMALKLLESLKVNHISPNTRDKINAAKVKRIRLIVNEILKKY